MDPTTTTATTTPTADTTVNLRIGAGTRVHASGSGGTSDYHRITRCGQDNSPIIRQQDYQTGAWCHRPYRAFVQTTDPVDCQGCLRNLPTPSHTTLPTT